MSFGPGIFAIGYTVGTGSVTSMIVAGSSFGMQLLWILSLSCLFSGLLIFLSGQYALTTGETALFAFKKHIPFGKVLAVLVILGISFGQWNSLVGILGITSNIVFEILVLNFPALDGHKYPIVIGLAVLIIGTMYLIMIKGDYSLFEKVLVILVSIMGLSFFFTLFFVFPHAEEILSGLVPRLPKVEGANKLAVAFVGTTMASATFVSRPLFVLQKGWTKKDLKHQKKDAIIAALLVFIISGSIMAVASGSLYRDGIVVSKVLDMSQALEPSAGKLAVSVFFFGTLGAGLSSIFPCLLIVPIMLSDFQSGKMDIKSKRFKVITGVASLVALTIPIFGVNPIDGQIITQVFNVFPLPLVIIGIMFLSNRRVDGHKNGILINTILVAALVFSIAISVEGVNAIISSF